MRKAVCARPVERMPRIPPGGSRRMRSGGTRFRTGPRITKENQSMYRRNATSNSRIMVGAVSALAVAIGTLLIGAAPAKADPSFGFFFSAPFPFPPIPVPVVVEHDAYYGPPAVVYERPYYERSYYPQEYRHHHNRHCHHGNHGGYGWQGRSSWDDDDHHYDRRDVRWGSRY